MNFYIGFSQYFPSKHLTQELPFVLETKMFKGKESICGKKFAGF